jgi:hypothetical protein
MKIKDISRAARKGFSALQVIFWFAKQENILIRALICGPKIPVWVAGKSSRIMVGIVNMSPVLRSFSVFLRARYPQIAELALARANSVNFIDSAR